MKKIGLIILLIMIVLPLVLSVDSPSLSSVPLSNELDYNKAQGTIDNLTPLDENGQINSSKYKPFVSKAEQRIDNINLWLKTNASWLSIIFGMVPEISWTFTLTLYFILFFSLILLFNAPDTLSFFGSSGRSRLFGAILFIILGVVKFYLILAQTTLHLIRYIFTMDKLKDAGVIGWIVLIVLLVLFVMFLLLIPKILSNMGKASREKKELGMTQTDREVLHAAAQAIVEK